ncbi:hypothetical protein SNE25_22415 [Mucilaginibacter sabulilitoris]|uniref:Uncharacterized protein n=1 Tax=Mucilaginibacter sabulilitoris TaxID=1173583 RepID=A0ABZ0TIT3_9SPHI|nr:hypothetical protein [Mucilaginibacter sabulilitoris]WPU92078.1 hypothetical protein SNE25_22415 [Mucilaginibacter sabulilitoris]
MALLLKQYAGNASTIAFGQKMQKPGCGVSTTALSQIIEFQFIEQSS